MDVNRLYIASVYVCVKKELDMESIHIMQGLPFVINNLLGKFCKNTIVYHGDKNVYIDLITKEKYKLGIDEVSNIGEMYIKLENSLRPIDKVFDVEFKKKNMSRKRIVKTLYKSKLLNKKEDNK